MDLEQGITVLSLFDGMSCGMIALDRLGIKVKAYYASEIDKPAIKVSKHNWPNIIHIGDVTKVGYFESYLYCETGTYYVGKIDLLIGGSPCQGFSFAGKQLNFEDPRSKLFFEYVRLLKETEAEYFLLENVRMKKQYEAIITQYVKIEPLFINSCLLSAQNRKRLYWTNIPYLGLPEDKGIILKDILQNGSTTVLRWQNKMTGPINDLEKSACLRASGGTDIRKRQRVVLPGCEIFSLEKYSGKCQKQILKNSKNIHEKSIAVCTNSNTTGSGVNVIDFENGMYRKINPIEAERLQTVPDNYTSLVSDTQRFKMLGNGWTVDVICHLFEPLLYVI